MTDSGSSRGCNDSKSDPRSSKQLHFIKIPMLLSVFLPKCKIYLGLTNQRHLMIHINQSEARSLGDVVATLLCNAFCLKY